MIRPNRQPPTANQLDAICAIDAGTVCRHNDDSCQAPVA